MKIQSKRALRAIAFIMPALTPTPGLITAFAFGYGYIGAAELLGAIISVCFLGLTNAHYSHKLGELEYSECFKMQRFGIDDGLNGYRFKNYLGGGVICLVFAIILPVIAGLGAALNPNLEIHLLISFVVLGLLSSALSSFFAYKAGIFQNLMANSNYE